MGIFSREPDLNGEPDMNDVEPEAEPISLYTNAPTHWPVVMTDPLIPEGIPGGDSMNVANFGTAMKSAFEAANCGCSLAAMLRPILTPDGVLEIPIIVNDSSKLIPVFLYSNSTEVSASLYYGSAAVLRYRGFNEPVYYAPAPLPQVAPGNPLRPFSVELLSRHQGQLPKGNYAILWADENNPNILTTKCLKDIHRVNQALAGIESYVLASIFRVLQLVDSNVQRMKLPQKTMTIPIIGPEDQKFILSVSEEKGIRFHFNSEITGAEYRDSFWSVFAAYAEAWKNDAIRQQMELDYTKGTPPSSRYWVDTLNLLYKQAQGVSEIGVVTI
ncbi:MAG: hypothetical protein JSV49_12690 [Thermoplasmata archaeon]|nr:MAG: hypothetical protein JSV49_12690 [Thermoplasmata archaeon]